MKIINFLLCNTAYFFIAGLIISPVIAANISHNNTGQALIFPYYTVNNDLNSLISVVNTTDQVKAVKIRFLEGDNGISVFSFNVYLSAFDTYTAALVKSSDSSNNNLVRILSNDNTCNNLQFPETFQPREGIDAERTTEGHLEIIEMATITDPLLIQATTQILQGVPANCDQLNDAWLDNGRWTLDPTDGVGPAAGGLMGAVYLVNVGEGNSVNVEPLVIEDFYPDNGLLLTEPNAAEPNLSSAEPKSLILHNSKIYESEWNSGFDAISALMMHDQIINQHTLNQSINSRTEFVITFPTKRFYVNNDTVALPPFNSIFQPDKGACEEFVYEIYNRERSNYGSFDGDPIPPKPKLCWHTNVVYFFDNDIGETWESVSRTLGSTNITNFSPSPLTEGWTNFRFYEAAPLIDKNDIYVYQGFPVIGFSIQTFSNRNAQPGLLAKYSALYPHIFTTIINNSGSK